MRRFTWALGLLVLAFPATSIAQNADEKCRSDVPKHLDWCKGDTGYNEGAVCGANALAGIAGIQVPDAAQPALGNVWHRDAMMRATIQAWKAGAKSQAMDAAICCQVHNGEAHACLSSHHDQVKDWLNGQ